MSQTEVKTLADFQTVITIRKLFIVFLVTFSIFLVFQFYEFQPSKCSWRKLNANLKFESELCPIRPPNLIGSFHPDINNMALESLEKQFAGSAVKSGGYYKPPDCIARDRVAIVIPCRGEERERHIPILLKNLHPMLMRQQLEYQVFIVFQTPEFLFNKGALLNAGFLEAMKIRQWDCIIFHDVDTIPMDDRNMYDCPRANIRHLYT